MKDFKPETWKNKSSKDLPKPKNRKSAIQDYVKPKPKLNAQTNTLCESVSGEFGSFEWSESMFERMKKESSEIAYLFIFQYETGCRLSEAQLITYDKIMSNGDVKLQATKNSQDRIVSAGRCAKYLISCRKARCSPFMNFNRFFIHRFYKKYGVIFQSAGSKKMSVTHAIRHLKVQTMRNEGVTNEQISVVIGHKNQKNSEIYGKKK